MYAMSLAATVTVTVAGTSRTLIGIIIVDSGNIQLVVLNSAATGVEIVKNPAP